MRFHRTGFVLLVLVLLPLVGCNYQNIGKTCLAMDLGTDFTNFEIVTGPDQEPGCSYTYGATTEVLFSTAATAPSGKPTRGWVEGIEVTSVEEVTKIAHVTELLHNATGMGGPATLPTSASWQAFPPLAGRIWVRNNRIRVFTTDKPLPLPDEEVGSFCASVYRHHEGWPCEVSAAEDASAKHILGLLALLHDSGVETLNLRTRAPADATGGLLLTVGGLELELGAIVGQEWQARTLQDLVVEIEKR